MKRQGSRVASLFVLLVLTTFVALLLGVTSLTPSALFEGLTRSTSDVHEILWQIRLPRIALAIVVGAALAVAGVLSQSLFANPIAEPSIIGIASGSATGLLVGVIAGVASIGSLASMIAAITGAIVVSLLINRYARNSMTNQSALAFLLAGIATAAVLNAVIGVLTNVGRSGELRSISFWTLGSFSLATWANLWLVLPFVVIGIALAIYVSHQLDYLALGSQTARHMGIEVKQVRLVALIALAFLVSAGVAVTGIIAFVGLAVPHIIRLIFGPLHRALIVLSAIAGAILVVAADTLARWVFQPTELPIGLITAILGAPVLLFALRSLRVSQ